jgi:flagellar protein FlbD
MIALTRTTGERCCLDPAHIVRAESDPDTVVTMTDGAKYVVVETVAQVIERVRNFRAAVTVSAWRWVHVPEGEAGTVVTRATALRTP